MVSTLSVQQRFARWRFASTNLCLAVVMIAAMFKTPLPPLAGPDSYDVDDVAVMLREIGIALIEVAQPIQVVEARLTDIAESYTTESVEIAALPTMLLIQIGTRAFQLDGSAQPSSQLDMAARIDQVAGLARGGAIPTGAAVAARGHPGSARSRHDTLAGYAVWATVGFRDDHPNRRGMPCRPICSWAWW